jgi:ABC-type glycerol-3-phosphate transport system substrate-binding protein
MFKDKACSVMTGGWNVSIAAATKNAKEAWLLTDYLTRVKHADWVNNSGYLPVRKTLMGDAKFKDYPWNIFIEELNKCSANRPATSKYNFFFDTYKQAITDIATGKPAQATLDAAAQKIDAELAR